MSSFTTPLKVEFLDGKYWCVLEPFVYEVGKKGSGKEICVVDKFITDFASIPWFFQWLISKTKGHGKAAVLHDYLYCYAEMFGKPCTRKQADLVFFEAIGVLYEKHKVFWPLRFRRYLMYVAVRWFGWWAWNNNQRNPESCEAQRYAGSRAKYAPQTRRKTMISR